MVYSSRLIVCFETQNSHVQLDDSLLTIACEMVTDSDLVPDHQVQVRAQGLCWWLAHARV